MNNLTSKSNQVFVGPVAKQLSQRRPRPKSWLPKLALVICTIACGFIVHTALVDHQARHNEQRLADSWDQPPPLVNSLVPRQQAGYTQVRSVIELLGAFKHVETEVAEHRNPLALPDDSATAPVAYYTTPQPDRAKETAGFLQQIHADEFPVDAPDEYETPHTDNKPKRLAFDPPKSEIPLHNLPMERAQELSLDQPQIVAAARASQLKHTRLNQLPIVPSAIQLIPTPDSHADLARSSSPDNRAEPETPAVSEVPDTVAEYDKAILDLAENPNDRDVSRRAYVALAELGASTWSTELDAGKTRLAKIFGKPHLLKLTSSAVASWIKWGKRTSPGIVVSGQIQSVASYEDGYLVDLKLPDRHSTMLSVYTTNDVGSLSDSTEIAVFYGVITVNSDSGEPLVQANYLEPDQ